MMIATGRTTAEDLEDLAVAAQEPGGEPSPRVRMPASFYHRGGKVADVVAAAEVEAARQAALAAAAAPVISAAYWARRVVSVDDAVAGVHYAAVATVNESDAPLFLGTFVSVDAAKMVAYHADTILHAFGFRYDAVDSHLGLIRLTQSPELFGILRRLHGQGGDLAVSCASDWAHRLVCLWLRLHFEEAAPVDADAADVLLTLGDFYWRGMPPSGACMRAAPEFIEAQRAFVTARTSASPAVSVPMLRAGVLGRAGVLPPKAFVECSLP
jgi:hypothetical protein